MQDENGQGNKMKGTRGTDQAKRGKRKMASFGRRDYKREPGPKQCRRSKVDETNHQERMGNAR